MGAAGALNAVPKAPLSRRATDIPPKAGAREYLLNYYECGIDHEEQNYSN